MQRTFYYNCPLIAEFLLWMKWDQFYLFELIYWIRTFPSFSPYKLKVGVIGLIFLQRSGLVLSVVSHFLEPIMTKGKAKHLGKQRD